MKRFKPNHVVAKFLMAQLALSSLMVVSAPIFVQAAYSPSSVKKQKTPALILAVQANDLKEVKRLLRAGVDSNTKDPNTGRSSLHYAKSIEVAQALLDAGAKVDFEDYYGFTPFFNAVFAGRSDLSKFLLSKGANAAHLTKLNYNPLDAASIIGLAPIVETLVKLKGVDINRRGNDGETPLHLVADGLHLSKPGRETEYAACAQALINAGAEPDSADGGRQTPLFKTAINDNYAVAKVLIATGKVDVNHGTENGFPVAIWASSNGSNRVLKLLLENGADVNATDNYGSTVLHHAKTHETAQIIRSFGGKTSKELREEWRKNHLGIGVR